MGCKTQRGHKKAFVVAVIAVFAIITLAPRAALAANTYNPFMKKVTSVKSGKTLTLYMSYKAGIQYYGLTAGRGTITNVKSSNEAAVLTNLQQYGNGDALFLLANNTGKAKVSFKYKGRKRTITVVVKEYQKACKSIKIGKTNIMRKINVIERYASIGSSKLRGKRITVKPAKGWKVAKIQAQVENGKTKNIKNRGKIPKTAYGVTVYMQNTKTKGYIVYGAF